MHRNLLISIGLSAALSMPLAGATQPPGTAAQGGEPASGTQRGARIDDAYAEVLAARRALEHAETQRERGRAPLAGERLGTAGGASRLAPAYWERQDALEDNVERARRQLQAALHAWNALK